MPKLIDRFFTADSDTELVLALVAEQWQKIIENGINAHYSDAIALKLIRDELAINFDDEKSVNAF